MDSSGLMSSRLFGSCLARMHVIVPGTRGDFELLKRHRAFSNVPHGTFRAHLPRVFQGRLSFKKCVCLVLLLQTAADSS
jgi:hypothetical protein